MECNSFSKLYLYLVRKSMPYIFCKYIQEKIDKFISRFNKIKYCVEDTYFWAEFPLSSISYFIMNLQEIEEAIKELIDISKSARIQTIKPVFTEHVKKIERFVENYEARKETLEEIMKAINFKMGGLRKYGLPPNKCNEISIYISPGGRICTPRSNDEVVTNFLLKRVKDYYEAYSFSFVHVFIVPKLIKKGIHLNLQFKYLDTNRFVGSNKVGRIVAVPVERYADVIDSYVSEKVSEIVFLKTFSGG